MDPIPMLLWCPECGARHVDEGEFATKSHHTHSCQACGMTWRPAVVPTTGVQFLPGFSNGDPPAAAPVSEEDPRIQENRECESIAREASSVWEVTVGVTDQQVKAARESCDYIAECIVARRRLTLGSSS